MPAPYIPPLPLPPVTMGPLKKRRPLPIRRPVIPIILPPTVPPEQLYEGFYLGGRPTPWCRDNAPNIGIRG